MAAISRTIFEQIFAQQGLQSDVAQDIEGLIEDHFAAPDFPFNLLIASFCEPDDVLSQWRGYNGAIGYAIGFNVDWLQQNAHAQGFQLVRARYEPEEQQQTIIDEFHSLKASLEEEAGQNPSWKTAKKWWPGMLVTMAALKDKHFEEEKEWRLVKAKSGWERGISTRTGPSGLIPYLPIKLNAKHTNRLSREAKNIGIERIIVRVEIGKSRIPYIPNNYRVR
jgi:hypothetical protein